MAAALLLAAVAANHVSVSSECTAAARTEAVRVESGYKAFVSELLSKLSKVREGVGGRKDG
eukprot:scaffold220224_cov13-Tisochrysis_lutea.AAC.1